VFRLDVNCYAERWILKRYRAPGGRGRHPRGAGRRVAV